MKRDAKAERRVFFRPRTSPATLSNGNCAMRASFVAAPSIQPSMSTDLPSDQPGMSKRRNAAEATLTFSASEKRTVPPRDTIGTPTFSRMRE